MTDESNNEELSRLQRTVNALKEPGSVVTIRHSSEEDPHGFIWRISDALRHDDCQAKELRFTEALEPLQAQVIGDALSHNDSVIEVHFHSLDNDSVVALSAGIRNGRKQLKKLVFFESKFTVQGVRALAKCHAGLDQIGFLDCKQLGVDGVTALMESFPSNSTTIKHLGFPFCLIGPDHCRAITRALKNTPSVVELDLRFNWLISNGGSVALANGLAHNVYLKRLRLGDCKIGNEGAIALGRYLRRNKHLQELRLQSNYDITLEGITALANGLARNTSLFVLNLQNNAAAAEGTAIRMRIDTYLRANKVLRELHSQEELPIRAWPLVYEQVCGHPAAMYTMLQTVDFVRLRAEMQTDDEEEQTGAEEEEEDAEESG